MLWRVTSNPAATATGSPTSATTASAVPPAAVIVSTVAASVAGLRSHAETWRPTAAAWTATERPMPLPAPVTTIVSPGWKPRAMSGMRPSLGENWTPALATIANHRIVTREVEMFEEHVTGLAFPEAARWHDGHLWFSDMHDERVFRVDGPGRISEVARVPGDPAGLGWLPDGRLLVVSMHDRKPAAPRPRRPHRARRPRPHRHLALQRHGRRRAGPRLRRQLRRRLRARHADHAGGPRARAPGRHGRGRRRAGWSSRTARPSATARSSSPRPAPTRPGSPRSTSNRTAR